MIPVVFTINHNSTQGQSLYDTIFEKMDEAIDMKKGLLKDTKDVGF